MCVREKARERAKNRTTEQRQASRKRAAERGGRRYRTSQERSARKHLVANVRAHASALRAWWRFCAASSLADLDRAERNRLKWRDRYARFRDAEIARSREKKRRYRASFRDVGVVEKELIAWRDQATDCAYCACKLADGERHIDHIVPISAGGTSEPTNLTVCCASCSLSKAAKPVTTWLTEMAA